MPVLDEDAEPAAPARTRTLPDGVVRHLLHSAVALQAEKSLLRTIGVLAFAAHRSEGSAAAVDWIAWVERDVRPRPAGPRRARPRGDPAGRAGRRRRRPERPETVVEGLLAGHEEALRVLRDLDTLAGEDEWHDVVS